MDIGFGLCSNRVIWLAADSYLSKRRESFESIFFPFPSRLPLPSSYRHGCQVLVLSTPSPRCTCLFVHPIYHDRSVSRPFMVAPPLCGDKGLYVIWDMISSQSSLSQLVPELTSRSRTIIIVVGAIYTLAAILGLLGSAPPQTMTPESSG